MAPSVRNLLSAVRAVFIEELFVLKFLIFPGFFFAHFFSIRFSWGFLSEYVNASSSRFSGAVKIHTL